MKSDTCCIVCGKKRAPEYKLPHGTFRVCNLKCRDVLVREISGSNPVLWANFDDLEEHSILSKEQLKSYTKEDERKMARLFTDYLWKDDSFGETFHDLLEMAAERMEEMRVLGTPEKKLPLLLHDLEFDSNKKVLEKRLKGETVGGIVDVE